MAQRERSGVSGTRAAAVGAPRQEFLLPNGVRGGPGRTLIQRNSNEELRIDGWNRGTIGSAGSRRAPLDRLAALAPAHDGGSIEDGGGTCNTCGSDLRPRLTDASLFARYFLEISHF